MLRAALVHCSTSAAIPIPMLSRSGWGCTLLSIQLTMNQRTTVSFSRGNHQHRGVICEIATTSTDSVPQQELRGNKRDEAVLLSSHEFSLQDGAELARSL